MNLDALLARATATAYPEPDTPVHSHIIPLVIPIFAKHCPPPATVLDIGCGFCFGAKALRDAGYSVTPISVLPVEVESAKLLGFNSELCEMHDTERLGRFDVAWARHIAEHSPCPLLFLSGLLNQANWLYLEVPAPGTAAMHENNPNHYSCLTPHGWINIIARSGWQIVESQKLEMELHCGKDSYVLFICKK